MEKYITQLGKSSIIYGIGNILVKLVAFILIPLYTRYLTPADYGVISLLVLFEQFSVAILGFGIGNAIFRYFPQLREKRRENELVFSAFLFLLAINLAICTFLFFNAAPLARSLLSLSGRNILYLKLTVLVYFFETIKILLTVILRSEEKALAFSAFMLFSFISLLTFNIINVAWLRKGILGVVESNLWAGSIGFILSLSYILRKFKPAFSISRLKESLLYGIPMIPAGVATLILTLSDRYFLKWFSTMETVGIYSVSYKIGMISNMLLVMPFRLAWRPFMFSVQNESNAKQIYSSILTYFVFIGFLLVLGLSIFSKDILTILTTEDYIAGYKIVPLIALSYLLFGIFLIVDNGILLKNKTAYYPLITGFGALLNILLNYILIPNYGMWGAAIATTISYFGIVVIMYFVSQKFYQVKYQFDRIGKIISVFAGTYALSFFLQPENTILSVILKLILISTYPFLLYLLKFYQQVEIENIKRVFSRKTLRKPSFQEHLL